MDQSSNTDIKMGLEGLRNQDTTQHFTTSSFIGHWYHAALLFSGIGSTVLLFVLLLSQQIREDLVRAAYRVTPTSHLCSPRLILVF